MRPEIILTADGSHSLFLRDLNENYHSVNGAITESVHVFINNGLLFRKQLAMTVFEVGFGTGLNALLTAFFAENKGFTIHYLSVEKYPLEPETIQGLNYPEQMGKGGRMLWEKIQKAAWNKKITISNFFHLTKLRLDMTSLDLPKDSGGFDVIYFDAFSPDVQPEMWQPEIFELLFQKCNRGAVITTYSAKGEVRRRMKAAGFSVEKLPGPPGKKEMLRGIITD